MVFQVLNRLVWKGGMDKAEIVILHRGAPMDRKIIKGKDITKVKKNYFYYHSIRGEVCIPLHRVLEVRVEGNVIWKRKR